MLCFLFLKKNIDIDESSANSLENSYERMKIVTRDEEIRKGSRADWRTYNDINQE